MSTIEIALALAPEEWAQRRVAALRLTASEISRRRAGSRVIDVVTSDQVLNGE
ncbi:MAG TPA: hypothetical protein VGH98_16650 [Gemmatimonadaceae bacterium]|jgi:hypothetical protein